MAIRERGEGGERKKITGKEKKTAVIYSANLKKKKLLGLITSTHFQYHWF